MAQLELEELTAQLSAAAKASDPSATLRQSLRDALTTPDLIADEIAAKPDDEVLLFEDDACSIWSCRYTPGDVLAPHEHCMAAHIAVFRGVEVEVLYKPEGGELRHGGNLNVAAGELITLGPDAVHAVSAAGKAQSCAIHVYEGPLTKVERRLFDWNTGAAIPFTMENFHAMMRKSADMAEFA
ncbi:MAG: hypothetical protein AAF401_01625 [Pseudomonadota bacterium]